MKKIVAKLTILAVMLLGLPLSGVKCAGNDISTYLEFPPKTRYVEHEPFSLPVFLGVGLFVLLVVFPFIKHAYAYRSVEAKADKNRLPFPWWGYAGLMMGTGSWILAWTRFEWFGLFQLHTFTPLWIAYIVVINALTYKRSGHCMMVDQPGYFLLLFPVSTAFWWFFEYLNRFVQNWYYVEAHRFSPAEYFILASVSFSTVLPAVLGTRGYLLTFSFFDRAFGSFARLSLPKPKQFGAVFLLISGMGLTCIGLFPNYLYPLLWVSPLVIIVSFQALAGEQHIFSALAEGDWRLFVTSALAALICGFFWEMWNFYSLAKWIYSIPYAQRLHVFEMPLLGFAGYLPFGLGCAVIGDLVDQSKNLLFNKNRGVKAKAG
jgi:hypothetical protein